MAWSPNFFASLYPVAVVLDDGHNYVYWDGHEDWHPTEFTYCDTYTGGVYNGHTDQCPLADKPSDSDHISVSAAGFLDSDFVSVQWASSGIGFNGAYDTLCFGVGEGSVGLLSGGCRPKSPIYPVIDVMNDKGYQYVIDGDGNNLRTAFGSGAEDGFIPHPPAADGQTIYGGNWFIVNPSPVTYPGIDATNDANLILFALDDRPSEFWLHFRSPLGTPVKVGKTSADFTAFATFWKIYNPEDDTPIPGFIAPGIPISGRVRRKRRLNA